MNTDARVKVGDYFYYGLGTDDIGLIEDDSNEDLEEILNREKTIKKETEGILNEYHGKKEGKKDQEKDKVDHSSDMKNEKEDKKKEESEEETKEEKNNKDEDELKKDDKDEEENENKDKEENKDEKEKEKEKAKDTKVIPEKDKLKFKDTENKDNKKEESPKKKKNSIFDIVIYLKSKFYIGHGTVLYKKAVANYQVAADLYSSIAMWNLGWMYENGVGVETVSLYIYISFCLFVCLCCFVLLCFVLYFFDKIFS